MNWRDLPPLASLRAFGAYAQTGTVQAAGAALNVSHAAISQQIRNLEAHIGVRLLDRSGRQAQITPEGQLLARAILEGFGQIEAQSRQLSGAADDKPLFVSTTPSFAAGWLMPRLSDFRTKHPQIDVVFDAHHEVIDLHNSDADMAIRFGSGDWSGLDSELLIETHMVAVAAPSLLPDAQKVDLTTLRNLPVLQEIGTSENTNWLERHGLSQAGGGGRVALPGSLTLDAARAGQGIAVAARVWVDADLAAGRLVQLFQDPQAFGYFIVTRPGVPRPALKAFKRWLGTQRPG